MTEKKEPRADEARVKVTNKRVLGPDAADPAAGPAQPETRQPESEHGELERARAQAASHLEDLQRLKAEFENYRKRMIKEQTGMVERASAAVIERLLPILDNFELALMAADRTKDYEAMVRGVEMVYGELLEVLRKEGLERIEALHQPFDPAQHEAVMRAEGLDGEGQGDEIVVDEMRPGYKLAGRVLRPAMVKVGPKGGARK